MPSANDIPAIREATGAFNVIGRDQLVLSILDDDSKPEPKKKGAHGYRPPRYGTKDYPL